MEDENMSFIKRTIDAMNKISVKGFPAILSLVDERVRISSNDVEKIARIIASEKRKR
jgi:NurA-like 5'-3' nuclease